MMMGKNEAEDACNGIYHQDPILSPVWIAVLFLFDTNFQ
jgi:hypothetical protein